MRTCPEPRYYCWDRLAATILEAGLDTADLVGSLSRLEARFFGHRRSTNFRHNGATGIDSSIGDITFSRPSRWCPVIATTVTGLVQRTRSPGPRLRPPSQDFRQKARSRGTAEAAVLTSSARQKATAAPATSRFHAPIDPAQPPLP